MSQLSLQEKRKSSNSIPRWLKLAGIIFVVLILALVIMHITGNSLGGPGGHTMPVLPGAPQP